MPLPNCVPVFLALCILTACVGAPLKKQSTVLSEIEKQQADLEAIEELHLRDMTASKSGDFETLRLLMADDAVVLPPGGAALRGRAQLDANFQRMQAALREMEVLDYRLDFEEVRLLGDYACEWGTISGAMRPRNGGPEQRYSYKVMRILQRQASGEWKVHRSIWNENPAETNQQP